MRTALRAVASVKFQFHLEAALGVEARRDRTGLAAAKRIRRIRQSARTRDDLQALLLDLEGHSRQTVLEVSAFRGIKNTE